MPESYVVQKRFSNGTNGWYRDAGNAGHCWTAAKYDATRFPFKPEAQEVADKHGAKVVLESEMTHR